MELTNIVQGMVRNLFTAEEAAKVESLLVEDCGTNMPGINPTNTNTIERIRMGVLKISGGNFNELVQAVNLANTDYRDLLMAAGFGEDINAHVAWAKDYAS